MGTVIRHQAARLRAAIALACLVAGLLALVGATAAAAQAQDTVATTTVTGAITPVTAEHLADTVERADADGHQALVVLLDTPGGLVDATRLIAQSFLDAPLPVVVYVAPAGADAGSAGTFITYAAHVAAMAPATTIGAATPVDLEGGEVGDKVVENAAAFAQTLAEERGRDVEFAVASVRDGRSVTAPTALEEGVVDLIASDLDDLLAQLDGRAVEVRGVGEVTLRTDGVTAVEYEMGWARSLLAILADPNLAFVFLSLGTLGILYEIASPGLGLGGVIGVASLVLAMFSLAVLPVNWAGAVLIVVAFVMFVVELFMPGIGVGAAGGTAALVLGGVFLFQDQPGLGVDWWVIAPTAVLLFALAVLAGRIVLRSRRATSRAGSDDLIGRRLIVESAATGRPRARVSGTFWRLQAAEGAPPLRDGQSVEVVERRNLDLVVVPVGDRDQTGGDSPSSSPTT
ncbi:nodulation protein NfeD [Egicoccus sp. AB-alg2]|uniref:NfeD family protein n=1 Tax=Egicoccus sp. AB-alg2 TaxID=3242693 RepID=UPI00359D377B